MAVGSAMDALNAFERERTAQSTPEYIEHSSGVMLGLNECQMEELRKRTASWTICKRFAEITGKMDKLPPKNVTYFCVPEANGELQAVQNESCSPNPARRSLIVDFGEVSQDDLNRFRAGIQAEPRYSAALETIQVMTHKQRMDRSALELLPVFKALNGDVNKATTR